MNINSLTDGAVAALENESISGRRLPNHCRENFLLNNKGFNYYGVDLSNSNVDEIEDIIVACEAVECDTWKAQEDFFAYIKKSDLLIYAEKNQQIVGFCLISLLLINEYCFFTNDETMVLKAYQGYNIAINIVTTALLFFMKKIKLDGSIKKFIMVSISANPQVVNGYFSNTYWTNFDNSFRPSEELINIHRAYLEKYSMCLVDNRYPFCVKNAFPGSQQLDWSKKKYQFKEEIKTMLPPDFDHKERGDAWAFMFLTGLRKAFFNFIYMSLKYIGIHALFNRNLGILRIKKNLLVNTRLTRVRLIDGKFIDRRNCERRANHFAINGHGDERRIADRRRTERKAAAC